MALNNFDRITQKPGVIGGKPCICGMCLTVIFILCIIALSCNKSINKNNSFNEQPQLIDIKEWDYYEYSYDGRKLFNDLYRVNGDNEVTDNYTKLLSFILNDEPKKINYIINGNALIGTITKINIYSEYGDDFDKHGIEHLRYYSINYLEIEYENKNTDKEILKFRIYSVMHYMNNDNSYVLRISAKLLNDIEKLHDYFDGMYLGIIDIDFNQNIVKIIAEYVPNNYGVLF